MPAAPVSCVTLVEEYFAARPIVTRGFSMEGWAAGVLANAGEAPLLALPPPVLRLLVMPSFEANTILRVERFDGTARLVVSGSIAGKTTAVDRLLLAAERRALRDVIVAADLGGLAPIERTLGTDGVTSLFEIFDGKHHVIRHRWCLRNDTAQRGLTHLRRLEEFLLELATQ